ncbi:hypothetical protein [Caballeronia ptereochthonis]|nr:hypothetical protein [Caballeronia ptereochthonis]
MPDSAVNRNPDTLTGDTAAKSRRRAADTPAAQDIADTEKKLARAARSAQRLVRLSEDPRSGETLDLFAEDAERAHLQAMNTDIRQGTFEGFELPEVFLAAVQSNCGTAAPGANASDSTAAKHAARGSVASVVPVQGLFQDDAFQPAEAAAPLQGANETAGKPGAIAAAVPRAASLSSVALDGDANAAPQDEPAQAPGNAPHCPAAPVVHDRRGCNDAAAPELDHARATAFADIIDALYAVTAEQRTSTTAHARRMKTMLTIIVCVMLTTVATGIAQTVVLMRMSRDSKLQQDRMEQLMLNQQATLASLFDTDSATISMGRAPDTLRDDGGASPVQPVSAVKPDSAPNHARHAHRHAGSTAH